MFDEYSHISYRSTTRLYWNTYPYKVVLFNEEGTREPRSLCLMTVRSGTPFHWRDYIRWLRQRKMQRSRYVEKVRSFVPDGAVYCLKSAPTSVNVFFLDYDDAARFIDRTQHLVSEVWRPDSERQRLAMAADHKVLVRKTLFLGRYRWCITFVRLQDQEQTDFFEWEAMSFGQLDYHQHEATDGRDEHRSYLYIGNQNRLYLRDEKDVILTKLGNSDIISRIEKAVLVSEVEQHIAVEPDTDVG